MTPKNIIRLKHINIILLGLLIGLFISCKKNDDTSMLYSFNGKAQKGPFIKGTTVILNELNSNLGQTGRSFTSTITTDDGSFSLSSIELNSSYALLTANGFYFSEIYGKPSGATLSLQALTDLSGKESVNINVLTHIIKGRIENLVGNGMSFQEANKQAKSEFLTFLGITESSNKDFENLDISVNEESNAVLLSFSIILQRYSISWNEQPALTAELTQLLSELSSDFADNGTITNRKLIDTLLSNISQLNLLDIRKNIEKKYSDLGITVSIPNFEKYIAKFQQKHNETLYTSFAYPDIASPDPVTAPDGKIPNILVPSNTIFEAAPYSVAAITPLNQTLKVKFIGSNMTIGGPISGWEVINEYPNGFTIISQRQNALMSMLIHLQSTGSATVEYYENSSTTPTMTKRIEW